MARLILADDIQVAAALHQFALRTPFFYGRPNLHLEKYAKLHAFYNPRLSPVGVKQYFHFITNENPDAVQAHLARQV